MYSSLGASLTRDQQWTNLLANMDDLTSNPLPADASADTVATRQLVIATLAHAENVLQGADQAAADAAYADAQAQYRQFADTQRSKEMPSGLSLWLANLGLDITSPLAKWASIGAGLIVLYLFGPPVVGALLSRARIPQRQPNRRRGHRPRHYGVRRRRG